MRQLQLKFRVTSAQGGVNWPCESAEIQKGLPHRGDVEEEGLAELDDAAGFEGAEGVVAGDLVSVVEEADGEGGACKLAEDVGDGLRAERGGEEIVELPAGVPPQQDGGVADFGADTPAMSDPRPIFCSVGASSLPLGSSPCSVWNFCKAATVFESILPVGSPW